MGTLDTFFTSSGLTDRPLLNRSVTQATEENLLGGQKNPALAPLTNVKIPQCPHVTSVSSNGSSMVEELKRMKEAPAVPAVGSPISNGQVKPGQGLKAPEIIFLNDRAASDSRVLPVSGSSEARESLQIIHHSVPTTPSHVKLDPLVASSGVQAALESRPARSLRILLVDDDGLTRKLMSRMLTRHGHVCSEAIDGQDALDKLIGEEQVYDLVMLDNFMPKKTGVEVIRELRKQGRSDLVCGCTANAEKADQNEYRDAGLDELRICPSPPLPFFLKIRPSDVKLAQSGDSSNLMDTDSEFRRSFPPPPKKPPCFYL